MAKEKTVWICRECGQKQLKWSGSCFACKAWNTFEEEKEEGEVRARFSSPLLTASEPVSISQVGHCEIKRLSTGMGALDALLGGGVVPGSLILLAGDPGIGKSTLLLQLSHRFATCGLKVLYVCGEESIDQTALRAHRLGAVTDQLLLLNETLFSQVEKQIKKVKPDILIVDSVQILYKAEMTSAPGSVSQVKELATEFMHLAKGLGMATFLVGHVTKSGEIAGPKVLEHIVDTVLDFEGDRKEGYRIVRAVKNRFGPTDDIVLFQMGSKGLTEVIQPSLLFLDEKAKEMAGSVVTPVLEGSRALLVELQALVTPSAFPSPIRRSTGLDPNRLALLLAVLEKKVGYHLHKFDVFVSVAGGMKIVEPAIDLALILSIASSYSNQIVDPQTVVFGEVGLGGEVRSVTRLETRLKEAIQMGFSHCILPERNLRSLSEETKRKISCTGVAYVEEAIEEILRGYAAST